MARKSIITEAEMKRALSAAGKSGNVPRECILTKNSFRVIFIEKEEGGVANDHPKLKSWDEN
ncbi:MAG: hypothetical protein ABJN40_13415 [Sneathiella sp.]